MSCGIALLGGTQVYLASLIGYISPDHQVLRLKLAASGVEKDLVRLVTPHEIVRYATKQTADSHEVTFEVVGNLNDFFSIFVRCDLWKLIMNTIYCLTTFKSSATGANPFS